MPLSRYGLIAASVVVAACSGPESVAQSDERDPEAMTTAFVGVDVRPMDADRVLRDQTVLVQGDRIVAVGPASEIGVPAGATRIEGEGRTLLPGLADMHVHLEFDAGRWLPLFLDRGITTVLNLRGDPGHLALRQAVLDGEVLGPTVYTSGPFVNEPRVSTPEEARAAVEAHAEAGYDVLKIHGDLSAETFAALLDAARGAGLAVVGHAPRNLPLDAVVEGRMAMLAHAEEMIYTAFNRADDADLEAVRAFAPRAVEAGLWVTPTLVMFEGIVEQWGRPAHLDEVFTSADGVDLLTPDLALYWREQNPYFGRDPDDQDWIRQMYRFQLPLVRTLHEAGVPMMTGTDTPQPVMVPGVSLAGEIRQLVAAGLSPHEALEAATATPGTFVAEHIDADARFGQIRPGYRADLVLLDGDPVEDLGVLDRPAGVMARGRWFSRADLDEALDAVRTSYEDADPEASVVLSPDQLRQFEGTYSGEGAPFTLRFEVRGGTLYAVVVESGDGYRMEPESPTRFRVVGVPQDPVVTFMEDGQAEVEMGGTRFTVTRNSP